ncbi:hypothetical protein Pla110_08930 [Polystyrenella longa]|uniref:Uncharacterized protein n=1 Tax=Polystyrenella longa TaxID=2528007 RepID=A0A518CIY3_9PLAN|nr:hypothetical protein [Polystyrenella longa]QDU79188.1 hypothetical protein Pla110_08930 [Polystyrenella longa]
MDAVFSFAGFYLQLPTINDGLLAYQKILVTHQLLPALKTPASLSGAKPNDDTQNNPAELSPTSRHKKPLPCETIAVERFFVEYNQTV